MLSFMKPIGLLGITSFMLMGGICTKFDTGTNFNTRKEIGSTDISTWSTYTNDEMGLTFQYPSKFGSISALREKGCLIDESNQKDPCEHISLYFPDLGNTSIFLSSSTPLYIQNPPGREGYWGDEARNIITQESIKNRCDQDGLIDCKVYTNATGTLVAKTTNSFCGIGCDGPITLYYVKSKSDLYPGIVISAERLRKIDSVEKIFDQIVDTLDFIPQTVVYDSFSKEYVPLSETTEIIYKLSNRSNPDNNGIWKYFNAKSEHKKLISQEPNQTIAYSVAPSGNQLIYNTATHDENFQIIEESAVKLYDITTQNTTGLFEILTEQIFTGASYWDEVNDKIYYVLRSSQQDLHFPDPETTNFYEYDLRSKENRHIAHALDFVHSGDTTKGHTYVIGPSPDGQFIYFVNTGHGDSIFSAMWKLQRKTLEITKIYDAKEAGFFFPYILDTDLNRDLVVGYDKDKDQKSILFTLDTATGKINYLQDVDNLLFPQHAVIQDNNLIVGSTTSKGETRVWIYDLEFLDLKEIFTLDKSVSRFDRHYDDGQLFLQVSMHEYPSGMAEVDLTTKEIEEVEKFELPLDGIESSFVSNH